MEEEERKALPPEIEEVKTYAAIGYFWILFLVPLISKKDSEFCQFHGKQGAVLFGAEIIGAVVLAVLGFVLSFVPCVGWIIALLLWGAYVICAVGLSIWGFVTAMRGEYWKMPVLAPLAEKLNF